MCLLLFGLHQVPGHPVVVAANRDEYYDRPSEPPRLLSTTPVIVGGYDARAGGTWLGVNEHRVIVALTNRHTPDPPSAHCRSRGLLCLEALRETTAEGAARATSQALSRDSCNPFNLVAMDPASGWIVSNIDQFLPRQLEPGWHVVGNRRIDDPEDPRVIRATDVLDTLQIQSWQTTYPGLARLCSDHGSGSKDTPDAICVHGEGAGTRSASIIAVDSRGHIHYAHANGSPCETEFAPIADTDLLNRS